MKGEGGIFLFAFKEVGYLTDQEIDLILYKKVPAEMARFYVPAYHFKIKRHLSQVEVGRIDIRIGYTENTFYGGNIGYEIYAPFRGNHYAKKACEVIKRVGQMHGMKYLYIACVNENIASNKTCQHLQATYLGHFQIPLYHEMYTMGIKSINIYQWFI